MTQERARRNDRERFFICLSCFLFILIETLIYSRIWYSFYVGKYFLRVRYWNRGNWVYVGMFAVFLIIFGLIFQSYQISSGSRGELILSHVFMEAAVHIIAFIQLSFIVQKYWLRWPPLLLSFVLNLGISIAWCFTVKFFYKWLFPPRDALVITADHELHGLQDRTYTQYMIREVISPEVGWDEIRNMIMSGAFQTIIVNEIEVKLRNQILKLCYEESLPCYVVPGISDILLLGSERLTYFDTPLQFFRNGGNLSIDQSVIKRVGDIIISILILVITSPVFLVTILLVLMDTGKVFAKHEMLTKDGKTFHLIRFQVRNTNDERSWKSAEYLRQYSPIGKTINRLHIAGLPQLLNVIKGEISLVGPRPYTIRLTEKYYQELGPEVLYRLRVKGGILGNAQLNAKKGSGAMERLKMDLDYIENFSIRRDILIILRSIVPH